MWGLPENMGGPQTRAAHVRVGSHRMAVTV